MEIKRKQILKTMFMMELLESYHLNEEDESILNKLISSTTVKDQNENHTLSNEHSNTLATLIK